VVSSCRVLENRDTEMKKGARVKILNTFERGTVEHVHYISSAGSCSVYISHIVVLLDDGKKIHIVDSRLLEVLE